MQTAAQRGIAFAAVAGWEKPDVKSVKWKIQEQGGVCALPRACFPHVCHRHCSQHGRRHGTAQKAIAGVTLNTLQHTCPTHGFTGDQAKPAESTLEIARCQGAYEQDRKPKVQKENPSRKDFSVRRPRCNVDLVIPSNRPSAPQRARDPRRPRQVRSLHERKLSVPDLEVRREAREIETVIKYSETHDRRRA